MEKTGRVTAVILLILFASLIACVRVSQIGSTEGFNDELASRALTQTIGVCSLCLSPECAGARNMTEGFYCSMADIPAGYCAHQICDVVSAPSFAGSSLYEISLKRAK